MKNTNNLLKRMAERNDEQDGRLTISVDRRVLPILEKYRARESGGAGKARRASLGETAVELIEVAEELLQRYAHELNQSRGGVADHSNGDEVQRTSADDPDNGEAGAVAK